tara:strand:+ start:4060 stop:4185 length:126 start_codon:yes stop_codon:yes gene_type:complete
MIDAQKTYCIQDKEKYDREQLFDLIDKLLLRIQELEQQLHS